MADHPRAPARLTFRIVALFTLVFGLGTVGNAIYTAYEQSERTLALLERQALAQSRVIATVIAASMTHDGSASVALQPLLPDTDEPSRIALLTPAGELRSSLVRRNGRWTDGLSTAGTQPPQALIPRTVIREDADTGHRTVVAWIPVTGSHDLMWLRTESDTPAARSVFRHILRDSLLQAALALLIGIGTLSLALRRPFAALKQCTDFAEQLDHATGETLPLGTGSHETDRLAQALNWASLSLYDQRSALAESEARTGAILGAALDAVITFDGFGNVVEYNPAAEHMLGWTPAEAMQHPVIELLVAPEERDAGEYDLLHWLGQRFDSVIGHHMELDIRHRSGRRFPAQIAITATHMKGRALFTAFISDISERKAVEEQMMKARDAAEAANRAKSDFLANMSHEIRTPMNAIMGMTELALDTHLTGEQREYLTLVKQSSDALLTLIDDILDFSKIEAGHLDFEDIGFSLREVVGSIVRTLAPKPGRPVQLLCRIDPSVSDGVTGDPVRLRQVLVNLVGNALKFTERGSVEVSVTLVSQDAESQGLRFAVRDSGIGIPADKLEVIFDAFSQADTSTTRKFGGTGLGLAICTRLVRRMGGSLEVNSQPGEGSTFHFSIPMKRASADELPASGTASLDNVPVLVIEPASDSREQIAALLAQWHVDARLCADLDAGIGAIVAAETEAQCYRTLLVSEDLAARDGWALVQALAGQCATELPIVLLHDGDAPDLARLPEGVSGVVARPVRSDALLHALMNATRTGQDTRPPAPVQRALHVLLAEDNPVNQTLAVRLLQRLGHQVDIASNGVEAVERAANIRYDLILMDVQMPQMGGFEATRQIRAQDGAWHTPIIAMTAHAMAGDRERCIEAGMDAYVSKPIQIPALVDALEQAMKGHRAAPPDTDGPSADETETDTRPGHFDRLFTLGNLGGDSVLMRDLIVLFLRDYPAMLTGLRRALDESPAALKAQAHTIRGTVGNFGADRVAGLAARLERPDRNAANDTAADVEARVDELERAVTALAEELRAELATAA